ncbi:UvrD-helicase domain-containing protein [Gordonia jacobaea]|uniref:UvrD-helicase domain-containing protein n=1 Tax=Gordonia jacobaea TaxID=122202 RepID=UPI003D736696
MPDDDAVVPELDAAQLRVAQAPSDERLVVIAGAGQGKTEVVTGRLRTLIERDQLSASAELLVLSFSRAAVHAVRTRLSEREMAEVNVRTFDSFASELLIEADQEPASGFEARIRQATTLLADDDTIAEPIEGLQHVIVDEVQDLIGDRADFVMEILRHLPRDAGFTVLGDPLQGIYDFVLEASAGKTQSGDFLDHIVTDLGATTVTLEKNYRARGNDCLRAAGLGARLREASDAIDAQSQLDVFRGTLPRIDPGDWDFLRHVVGCSAVLCRTNADVLRISRQLVDHDIRHAVRRPAQSFGAARWLAPVLGGLNGPIVPRSEVETQLAQVLASEEAEDAWYLLKSVEGRGRSSEQIDLERIRRRVMAGSIPLTLTQDDASDIIVSTIHRAKGLEFDNVYIVEPANYYAPDGDPWTQIRLEYVALTRARDTITLVKALRTRSAVAEFGWLPGRLQERVGRQGSTRAGSIEIGSSDSYAARPAAMDGCDAVEIQHALGTAAVGCGVDAELDLEHSTRERPIYALTVDGTPIGRTTDDFGQAFATAFNIRGGQWPAELADMVLVSVETTAGDPRAVENEGIGPGGFWLVPRVAGLARPLWDVMEKVG